MLELAESQFEEVTSGTYTRSEVFELGRKDLNFFAALCLPDIFKHFFPAVHLAVWALLTEAVSNAPDLKKFGENLTLDPNFLKLALGLPRGHAKTTLLKLFEVWCLLYTDRQFIVTVCSREDLAINFLSDVCDILDSTNIKATFGDWRIAQETNEKTFKKFYFMGRPIILLATGKGSVRGLNVKHKRPEVIIMDDFQKEEASRSETQADQDLNWMLGTLMKLKDPRRCLYVYIGNMYMGPGCILKKLKKNPGWISFIVGAILSDGQPIWPELHSINSLMAEFESDASMGKPEIFFAEVMNDPDSGVNSLIDCNRIPSSPHEVNSICTGRFVIIDVALDKLKSDDTTIGGYGLYGADIVMEQLKFGSMNPEDTIKAALYMALSTGATVIAVESVAYQASLLFWMGKICEMLNITGIELVEVFTKGMPKNSRILQWFKRILPSPRQSGEGYEPPKEYLSNKVRNAVIWQISQFRDKRRDNVDDIMDNAAYAAQVVETYGEFIRIPELVINPQFEAAKVLEYNTPF
jgi:hypothetical protein